MAFDKCNFIQGPPGCGKTTSIWALARDMLGTTVLKDAVLELNASDDRFDYFFVSFLFLILEALILSEIVSKDLHRRKQHYQKDDTKLSFWMKQTA